MKITSRAARLGTAALGTLTGLAALVMPTVAHAETTEQPGDITYPSGARIVYGHFYAAPGTEPPGYDGDPWVADCLTRHPDAVTADAVTTGADLVCVGDAQEVYPSAGDDTYLWVGGEVNNGPLWPHGAYTPTFDPGYDVLSLADWTIGYDQATSGDLYGNRVRFDTEALTLTGHDDRMGTTVYQPGCTTGNNGFTINSGPGDDTLICLAGNLFTGDGDDTVRGGKFGTRIDTGDGNDTVTDIDGDSTVIAGPGADIITDVQAASVQAQDGNDTILRIDASTVSGGAGADVIRYVRGASVIYGLDGDDIITDVDASIVYAGDDDDTIRRATTDSQVSGGNGDDAIYGVSSGSTADAGSGSDLVVGDSGTDKIVLGSGNDTAKVEAGGADTVSGGTGSDTVYASSNDKVYSANVL